MELTKDPTEMTEEERFDEVASILALGLSRLRGRAGYLEALTSTEDGRGVPAPVASDRSSCVGPYIDGQN